MIKPGAKALVTMLVAVTGVFAAHGVAMADGPGAGGGPVAPPLEPVAGTLSDNQPLIELKISNGKVTSVTGTAVAPEHRVAPLASSRSATPAQAGVLCLVNFTRSKQLIGGHTFATWFGGIGCSRSMVLFGQAFLLETAKHYDGFGNYYERVARSEASGHRNTVINKPHPSLYIRHLTNVYFSQRTTSGAIAVIPAPRQQLNRASKCKAAQTVKYGIGVHCDLYSNRF